MQQNKPLDAITIVADAFVSPDLAYSQIASRDLGISPVILHVSIDDILDGIKETIKILRNFNEIEIRNSVVVYLAAKWAAENGHESLATGDGADELFAGYKFLIHTPEDKLSHEIKRVCDSMHFPSHAICKSFGIRPISPFLDADVMHLAKKIAPELKVRYDSIKPCSNRDGAQVNKGGSSSCDADPKSTLTRRYGKWILRKSFEDNLDARIVWRPKYAMQDGSGTVGLTEMFNSIIPEESYVEKILQIKDNDGVIIRNRESLYYYEIFRDLYGIPVEFDESDNFHNNAPDSMCDVSCGDVKETTTMSAPAAHRLCPFCKFKIPNNVRFCRMCAAFPI